MKRNAFLLLLFIAIFSTSCSVLQQANEAAAFSKCEFRLESVTKMKIAGVSIQDKSSLSQLGFSDMGKVTNAVAQGSLPMTFDLNLEVKNPNPSTAAMNKLDWILLIDDNEMTRGALYERVEVQPGSVTSFPIHVSFDLFKALSGQSGTSLLNFAFNLAGAGSKTTRVSVKAKPTIIIGSKSVEYPGYITITEKFGAN